MSTISLNALPSLASLYTTAAFKRNSQNLSSLPRCSLRIDDFKLDAKQVKRYQKQFNFDMRHGLPAPFIYLATQSMQLYLLTRHRFPLSPAGLVHLGIEFKQSCSLPLDWKGVVEMSITNQQHTKKGLIFDIETRLLSAVHHFDNKADRDSSNNPSNNVDLIMTNRYLAKAIKVQSQFDIPNMVNRAEPGRALPLRQRNISVENGSGRRYARLSGDYNPIHLYRWSSRLFGFKQPIIHGLFLVSEAYAELEKLVAGFVPESAFQFKSPLYLPGSASMSIDKTDDASYSVIISTPSKLHLLGHVIRKHGI